jgi:hypothetical protein
MHNGREGNKRRKRIDDKMIIKPKTKRKTRKELYDVYSPTLLSNIGSPIQVDNRKEREKKNKDWYCKTTNRYTTTTCKQGQDD